ncbi:MAG TPA: low molecular weight protein-tyrosine-phosphatase [Polyangia bacterium]|nr:low molecular weight protein-tyrosine-phosphatase [Polyangia bacterium]
MAAAPVRLCFVCLGNICRSPTAEAVMRHLVAAAGLSDRIQVDSAGTGDWHIGEPRDQRSQATGRARGIPLAGVARQFTADDFAGCDYVLAMDAKNRQALLAMAPDDQARAKIHMLRAFEPGAPSAAGGAAPDVPDPYYGGAHGFERVFDICQVACAGLLAHIRRQHGI